MKDKDFSILIRAVLFGIVIMAIGLLSGLMAAHFSAGVLPDLSGQIAVGLGLFVIWLVHGSTLRSIYRLDKNCSFIWLVFAGIATIFGGMVLAALVRLIIEKAAGIEFPVLASAGLGQKTLFLLGLALFLSFFSAINLKVKSRFFGNILELILIGATGFLIWTLLNNQ